MRIVLIITLMFQTVLSAQQPIILWDLHGVLLTRKNPLEIDHLPSITGTIKELSWPLIKNLIQVAYTNYVARTTNSQDFIEIAQKNNAPNTQALILAIVNAQKPMPGMQQIVQELADLGYRQQVGSNIGQSSFEQLANPAIYPELAPLFSLLEISTAQVAQRTHNQFIKKPNPAFFKEYLAKNNIDLATQPVLLVDDTQANIATAKKLGFDTIYFKHPNQLRDELIKRDIMVAPPSHHLTNQKKYTPLYDQFLFYRQP